MLKRSISATVTAQPPNGWIYFSSELTLIESSSDNAAAKPGFNFNTIADMTTCTSVTFTWFYGAATDSQPGDLEFTITSDIPGDSDLDQVITPETVDPLARSYTWPSVNTTPGGYQIIAQSLLALFFILSNSFKVVQGACRSKSQTTTKTPSSTGSSASVVANPSLNFNKISDMKNCTSAPINWFYSPATQQQPDDLTLTISSDVPGDTTLDQLITPEPLDPLARSYTWPSVKAIPGVYQIEARSDSAQWLILSGPFNVVNGIDTLCRAKSTNAVSASSTIPVGQTTTPASQTSTTPASQTTTSGPAVTSGGAGVMPPNCLETEELIIIDGN
ncbi:hypothetical protein B0H13DRAFT_1883170 [Mycena leptocephala]|nr:hypothetical protein B0H13DRAFT_1883170 [Mycena leptocephala]